jgi:hypothetical protein
MFGQFAVRGRIVSIAVGATVLAALGCSASEEADKEWTVTIQRAVEAGTGATDLAFALPNEPAIAVNPTNPNNMVFSLTPFSVLISNDGGATFPINATLGVPSTHSGDRDTSLAFDSQGRLFVCYLLFFNTSPPGGVDIFVQQINPATGAQVGSAINVTQQLGIGAAAGNGGHDKAWIAVDRSATSPFRDSLYVVWTQGNVVKTAHSPSPGTAWTGLLTLSSDTDCPSLMAGQTCFAWPTHVAVGRDGASYISYRTGAIVGGAGGGSSVNFFNFVADEHMVLFRSDNGGVSYGFSTSPATQPLTTNTGNLRLLDRTFTWTLGAGQDWVLPDPGNAQRLAIVFNRDPSPSPNDGVGFDDMDVFITRSTNRGATWSTPTRVNADSAGPLQMFPTAAWDSANDCVTVAWLDGRRGFADPAFRNSSGNVLLDVIIRMSADGGATFGPEFQVNDALINPEPGEGNFNVPGVRPAIRMGEYFGVLSRRGVVWPGGSGVINFDNSEHRCALNEACLLGSRNVDIRDRTVVTAPVTAGTRLEVGSVARVNGNGQVGGNALIRDRGVVNGDLTLAGVLQTQNIFTVTGTLIQNDSPVIVALQQKTFPVGTGFQEVPNGAITTLSPGNFGNMTIRARAQVTLGAGTYNFASLNIEPDVRITVTGGGVNVNVQGTFQFGDRSLIVPSGGGMLFVYSNGTQLRIGTDVRFTGLIVAPNATVNVFSRTNIAGCVGGRDVTLDADVTLNAGTLRLPVQ